MLHCYRSEPDFVPELSLVLEVDGEIIGPISIRPDYKCKGYGKTLLDHSMRIVAEMGAGCLLICGNIAFYGKSGFVVASTRGIRYADDPESDAPYFLCKELQEGFLDGITGSYRDPEPYFVAMRNPEAFEKYDAEFPPKEKLVLPGQLG